MYFSRHTYAPVISIQQHLASLETWCEQFCCVYRQHVCLLQSKGSESDSRQNLARFQPIPWVDRGAQMAPGHGWVATHCTGKAGGLRLDTELCAGNFHWDPLLLHHCFSLCQAGAGRGESELGQEILSCSMKSGQHCHAIPGW